MSDTDWDYRFTSQEWDNETALHYFNARYYHDGLGRFVGRDPLGYVDGGNLYAGYFAPNGTDPSGYATIAPPPPGTEAVVHPVLVACAYGYVLGELGAEYIVNPLLGPSYGRFFDWCHDNPPLWDPKLQPQPRPLPQPRPNQPPQPPRPPRRKPDNPDERDFYYAWCRWGVTADPCSRGKIWENWEGTTALCDECWEDCKATGRWPAQKCLPDTNLPGANWEADKTVWPDGWWKRASTMNPLDCQLSVDEEALLVATYYRGGSADDAYITSSSDQIITLSLFYTGSITPEDCADRFDRRGYVRQLYDAAGDLNNEIEERYEMLLRLLHRHPNLIEGYGFTNPPPHPTYTACRLTNEGVDTAKRLASKFPLQPVFQNWPDKRPRPDV